MSELLTGGTQPPPQTPPPPPVIIAPSYTLVGSYQTVQVLSPTTMNDVVYCTIKTAPSNVIASKTVQAELFNRGESGTNLANFAQAIEQIASDPRVVAGVGDQTIGQNGLLADTVVFTVEYRDPVKAPNGAHAFATVPVGQLDFSDAIIGRTLLAEVKAIIDGVYANLVAAAGG